MGILPRAWAMCVSATEKSKARHRPKQGGYNGCQAFHWCSAVTAHDKKSGNAAKNEKKAVASVMQVPCQSAPEPAFVFKKAAVKNLLEHCHILRRKWRGGFDGACQIEQCGEAPGNKAQQKPCPVPQQAVVFGPVKEKDGKQHAARHQGTDAVQVHAAARNKKNKRPELRFV